MAKLEYKWYVYKLIDPRSGNVFYIGKGSGRRAHQHKKDAVLGKDKNEHKENVILDILRSGCDVVISYDSYFKCEQSCLNRESELIASTQGLTNIAINKVKPITISLYKTISDIINKRISLNEAASNLNKLKRLAVFDDHILLISSFMSVAKKTLINQDDSDKVYG